MRPESPDALRNRARLFFALGDATRLAVLGKLLDGQMHSISRLTEGTAVSRQAVTKHLQVLAEAGVVRRIRAGRESLFQLEPQPIDELRTYLDRVSRQWDDALVRLRTLVERPQ